MTALRTLVPTALIYLLASLLPTLVAAPAVARGMGLDGMGFEHVAALRSVGDVALSPDGSLVAYTLTVPRIPGEDEDGPSWTELWVVHADPAAGEARPYVHGEVDVSDATFSPDGTLIYYLAKRDGDDHTSLWAVPVAGGESRRMLEHDTAISSYDLSPDGKRVLFLATDEQDEAAKKAAEQGFDAVVYEEDWRHAALWIADLPEFAPSPAAPMPHDPAADEEDAEDDAGPRRLDLDGTASDGFWSADGRRIVTALQPRNLIDDRYMKRKVHVIDAESGEVITRFDNPGKLGDYALSPDGTRLAMVSAADANDTATGRLLLGDVGSDAEGGVAKLRDVLPDFQAHVNGFQWQSADTLIWYASVGSETTVGSMRFGGTAGPDGQSERLFTSGDVSGDTSGDNAGDIAGDRVPVVTDLAVPADGGCAIAFVGETPSHPDEVYVAKLCGNPQPTRRTDSNPWLADVELAQQEVITWTASDGLELEGILIHPLKSSGGPAPLLLMVHGGPESNDRNGWVTNYSRPGQLAAAEGFAVLYPNYRGSTGRGVEFAKTSQGDAAGKEFQDLVEAVDHLVATGVADGDRVGITGGSYGGYATAWGSTYYSERFRAGVMFVGISNKLSKGFTTDIPVEDKMVHTLFDPWEKWQFTLDRSPLYHAEKSTTALLIAGGDADTRVHPSQSLQLYRAFKLMDKTVRYVRYPGEPHGNRRAASRDDYCRRLMRWMIHFVREKGEGLPPAELSAHRGSDEEGDKDEKDEKDEKDDES